MIDNLNSIVIMLFVMVFVNGFMCFYFSILLTEMSNDLKAIREKGLNGNIKKDFKNYPVHINGDIWGVAVGGNVDMDMVY